MMWKKDLMAQETMVFEAYADAMTQNKWFVVIGHHPYLSNGKHGNAGNYERLPGPYFVSGSAVKRFLDKNVCGKAQLYLSGHDHSLQVFDGNIKGCDTQLIVSGTGASATKLYKRNKADFESLELGFFSLDFEKDEVKVKAINDKEEVLFEKNYQRKIPVNEMAKKPLLRPSIHLGLNHR